MKSKTILLTIVFVLFLLKSESQITLDNTYTTGIVNNINFTIVKLSSSGYKYVSPNQTAKTITLYNLNHTIFKTIIIPASITNFWSFHFISETLFNTNTSDVECFVRENTPKTKCYVIDETGAIIFSKDSADFTNNVYNIPPWLSYSTGGVKMILHSTVNDKVFIYNLPGNLVCNDCTSGVISSVTELSNSGNPTNSISYPNPSSNEIKIKYALPQDNPKAKISFYSLDGKELKTFDIDNHIDFMTIDKATLGASSGMYLYKIYNTSELIATDKIVFD